MKVSYSWSNQPSGMKSKLPSDEYYHYGDNVIIDTTYNDKSGYKGYPDNMNYYTNDYSLYNLRYLNDKFYALDTKLSTDNLVYSTDGITWNTISLGLNKIRYITYGNNIYVICTESSIYYSTDLVS